MCKTRYLLRRHDNLFFRHPTDTNLKEWTSDALSAHQWVDIDAAASAAYIWNTLKGEEVAVSTLTLALTQQPQHQQPTASTPTALTLRDDSLNVYGVDLTA